MDLMHRPDSAKRGTTATAVQLWPRPTVLHPWAIEETHAWTAPTRLSTIFAHLDTTVPQVYPIVKLIAKTVCTLESINRRIEEVYGSVRGYQ